MATVWICVEIMRGNVVFVGDSPRGPLKQPGDPHLKPATSQNQMRIA
jgi:hypothetical protein